MRYSRGRPIWFCNQQHFKCYLQSFLKQTSPEISDEITKRAQTRLSELKEENLNISPYSQQAILNEELIYELTFIIDGKESVTKNERYACPEEERRAPEAP